MTRQKRQKAEMPGFMVFAYVVGIAVLVALVLITVKRSADIQLGNAAEFGIVGKILIGHGIIVDKPVIFPGSPVGPVGLVVVEGEGGEFPARERFIAFTNSGMNPEAGERVVLSRVTVLLQKRPPKLEQLLVAEAERRPTEGK